MLLQVVLQCLHGELLSQLVDEEPLSNNGRRGLREQWIGRQGANTIWPIMKP